MAGFDFDFSYSVDQQLYVDACIQAAKRRAHTLKCRWRVQRFPGAGRLRCIVDGQTRSLDLLGRVLEHDIPTICEGVRGGLTPEQARHLGIGFTELFLVGRQASVEEGCQVLIAVKQTTLYFPVFDFVEQRKGSPQLRARLRITEDVVTDFALGRYEPAVMLEEFHTALEHTLRELFQDLPRKKANWPGLIEAAEAAGYLYSEPGYPRQSEADQPEDSHSEGELHSHSDKLLLAELTQRRNRAKHEGGEPSDQWLFQHWQCVGAILETMVKRLQPQAG
ncbi:hypothetical protein [Arthrobacter globiformis]|uniref:hypothetical protein n=1 Tax=Arthrobacter globiformis TaxID=1665 RepID=UPI001557F608|nr:hypothetical protein [Arthrobacter globiformis]